MLESYTFVAPAHYASPLINGDCTGLSDEDQAEFDAWVKENPEKAKEVTGCAEETHIGRWNGLITDLIEYSALREVEVTKEVLESARPNTLIRGQAKAPRNLRWELFDINYGPHIDQVVERLGLRVLGHPEKEDEYHGNSKRFDDWDAALAYIAQGGTLVKIHDTKNSNYYRFFAVESDALPPDPARCAKKPPQIRNYYVEVPQACRDMVSPALNALGEAFDLGYTQGSTMRLFHVRTADRSKGRLERRIRAELGRIGKRGFSLSVLGAREAKTRTLCGF